MNTHAEDHALLCAAVREAGPVAMRFFRGTFEVREKNPGDPVTEADLAVDDLLAQKLRGQRPDYAWISEESLENTGRTEAARAWVVDPIDGTKAFVKGDDTFAIAVGLVEAGRPVCGVVFNPARDEFYDAVLDGGARLNGETIRATQTRAIAGAVLGTSHAELHRKLWVDSFPESDIRPIDSIAYKLAVMAAGQFDGVIALRPKSDWDIAAADLLVHEAGGVMSDTEGERLVYNRDTLLHPNLVAAGRVLHPLLCERLRAQKSSHPVQTST